MHVVIDGNNLIYAMRAHAPVPTVGRETMVRIIDRWARRGHEQVTLFLDGGAPREELAAQMKSSRIAVRFSGGKTADDLIVEMIHRTSSPDTLRVVSGDTAILHEARRRRCETTTPIDFISELFPPDDASGAPPARRREKPDEVSEEEARELLDLFDDEEEEFPGADAMRGE